MTNNSLLDPISATKSSPRKKNVIILAVSLASALGITTAVYAGLRDSKSEIAPKADNNSNNNLPHRQCHKGSSKRDKGISKSRNTGKRDDGPSDTSEEETESDGTESAEFETTVEELLKLRHLLLKLVLKKT